MDNDIIIILTSTVNVNNKKIYIHQTDPQQRLQTYLKSVREWLNKTLFKVVLIENSGYTFEELNDEKEIFKNRFEVITFDENVLEEAHDIKINNSKGVSELFSINYAIKNSKLILSSSFIIKITARYFIPELQDYLSLFNLNDYDAIVQHNRDRCELVGSNFKNLSSVFSMDTLKDLPDFLGHIESIYTYRTTKYEKLLICKEFAIEETQRGGSSNSFINI